MQNAERREAIQTPVLRYPEEPDYLSLDPALRGTSETGVWAFQQSGRKSRARKHLPIWYFILCSAFCIHHSAFSARANPSMEDVSKSISSNMDEKVDGRKVIGFLAGFAGLVILMVLINNRQQRKEVPKVTNHQGRLMRELMRSAGLKRSQIRQLKSLSDDLADRSQPVENLVTLLLCPSLIRKARERDPRDR
jgi:hypothetical protein